MTDAEAIAEAASRPTMRFVAVKSEAQQAAAMAYRTRDLLVRQRTQTINALRAHLAKLGIVAPAGPAHVGRFAAILDGDDGILPAGVQDLARLLLKKIEDLGEKIKGLDTELRRRAGTDDTARRLTTIPGIGPITAAAITTFAPPMRPSRRAGILRLGSASPRDSTRAAARSVSVERRRWGRRISEGC